MELRYTQLLGSRTMPVSFTHPSIYYAAFPDAEEDADPGTDAKAEQAPSSKCQHCIPAQDTAQRV